MIICWKLGRGARTGCLALVGCSTAYYYQLQPLETKYTVAFASNCLTNEGSKCRLCIISSLRKNMRIRVM